MGTPIGACYQCGAGMPKRAETFMCSVCRKLTANYNTSVANGLITQANAYNRQLTDHLRSHNKPKPLHSHHWVDGELLINGCPLPHKTMIFK